MSNRFTALIKGNHDLYESLILSKDSEDSLYEEISRLVGRKYDAAIDINIIHEWSARCEILNLDYHKIPDPQLLNVGIDRDKLSNIYDSSISSIRPDLIILSLEPDITEKLYVHKEKEFLFSASVVERRHADDSDNFHLSDEYECLGYSDANTYKRCLAEYITTIKNDYNCEIIIFNCSSYDPLDDVHDYRTVSDDYMPIRIQSFNLALMDMSREYNISIVDVDRIVAETGGGDTAPIIANATGPIYSAMRSECLRVIDEIGILGKKIQKEGAKDSNQSDNYMLINMPFVNKMTYTGELVEWHVAEGDSLCAGKDIADIYMDIAGREIRPLRERIKSASNKEKTAEPVESESINNPDAVSSQLRVRLTASEDGYVSRIITDKNSRTSVGDTLCIISTEKENDGQAYIDIGSVPDNQLFRVAVNIIT